MTRWAPFAWRVSSLLGRNSLVVSSASGVIAALGQILDRQGVYGAIYDLSFGFAAVGVFSMLAMAREHLRQSARARRASAKAAPEAGSVRPALSPRGDPAAGSPARARVDA